MAFKSGKDWNGNKDGRPKGSGLCLTSLLKIHLEKKPKGKKEYYKDLFIKKLLDKALVDNDIQALKLILNYTDGLPKQAVDLTSEGKRIGLFNYEDRNNNSNSENPSNGKKN